MPRRLLAIALIGSFLLTTLPAAQSQADGPEPFLPSPTNWSEIFETECGHLLRWHDDALGEDAATAWRTEFALCGLDVAKDQQMLSPIAEWCAYHERTGDQAADCAMEALETRELGPQSAALLEACSFVQAVVGTCDGSFFFNDLGVPVPDSAEMKTPVCVNVEHSGGQLGKWAGQIIRSDCEYTPEIGGDTVQPPDWEELLCDAGVCLDKFIDVMHWDHDFVPNSDACAGTIIEVSSEIKGTLNGGWLSSGVAGLWAIKFLLQVQTTIDWSAACGAEALFYGYAEGGYMRQLGFRRTDAANTGGPLCEFDGLVVTGCGKLTPITEWVSAGQHGIYNYEDQEGALPPITTVLGGNPNAQWHNEGQPPTHVVALLDRITDAVGGSRVYEVRYERANAQAPSSSLALGAINAAAETQA